MCCTDMCYGRGLVWRGRAAAPRLRKKKKAREGTDSEARRPSKEGPPLPLPPPLPGAPDGKGPSELAAWMQGFDWDGGHG